MRRWRRLLTALALTGYTLGCTRLEDPNDRFGVKATIAGSQGGGSSGGAPSGGEDTTGADFGNPGGTGGTSPDGGSGGHTDPYVSGSAGRPCWDPMGLDGLGCFACAPRNLSEFENACSTADCSPFDNAKRLPALGLTGSLPALPTRETAGAGGGGGTGSEKAVGGTAAAVGTSAAGQPSNAGNASPGVAAVNSSSCVELGATGKPIYVTGSSAARPFLQQIARQLVGLGISIVYTPTGSCVGVEAALNRMLIHTGPAPAPAPSAIFWSSSTSSGESCQLPAGGIVTDIGVSDVFAQTCPGFELSSLESQHVKDAHGPIQTMAFVVPATSKYREISAEAAYLVFGFGAQANVLDPTGSAPIWTDESLLFVRNPSSGTQAMLAAAIGVPSGQWHGKVHASSSEVSDAMRNVVRNRSDAADDALGILAVDYIDSNDLRAEIRILAFQDTNQNCAFYPDSTADSRDKRNVRDGHYPIWSPLHLLYRVDTNGSPENAASRQEISDILGYLSGSKPLPNGEQLMDVFAKSGLIPECAMRVTRTKDGGNLAPFSPGTPCSCSFEQAATGATACKPCSVQGDCKNDETCSLGYCEMQIRW